MDGKRPPLLMPVRCPCDGILGLVIGHVNALSPIFVIWLALWVGRSIPAAIFMFEGICMVALPAAVLIFRQLLQPYHPGCCYGLHYSRDLERGDIGTEWRMPHWYWVRIKLMLANWRQQWPVGLAGLLIFTGLFLGGYALCRRWAPPREELVKRAADHSFGEDKFMLYFLGLWFSIVNPILEEVFWRVYLREELREPWGPGCHISSATKGLRGLKAPYGSAQGEDHGRGGARPANVEMVQTAVGAACDEEVPHRPGSGHALEASSVGAATPAGEAGEGSPSAAGASQATISLHFSDAPSGSSTPLDYFSMEHYSETSLWLVSVYYASYHVVILRVFVAPWLALVGFAGLAILGRVFCCFCAHRRIGLLGAVGSHMGVDIGVCLMLADLFYGWMPAAVPQV